MNLEKEILQIINEAVSKKKDDKKEEKGDVDVTKKTNVLKWLKDEQENNAAIVRQLWPDKNEDSARSLFSKKLRGKDSKGKEYAFTEKEINTLYKLKNSFIGKID